MNLFYVCFHFYSTLSTQTYIEDCQYYNTSEKSHSGTNNSSLYDSNMSIALPTNCEISFDMSSYHGSGGQHRFFLLPKAQFNSGTTQPQSALWVDGVSNEYIDYGKRENNSTVNFNVGDAINCTDWHTIKYVIEGTTVKVYRDDILKTTQTISWIGNYTDYCLSIMHWSSSGTSKIKNVKIKQL